MRKMVYVLTILLLLPACGEKQDDTLSAPRDGARQQNRAITESSSAPDTQSAKPEQAAPEPADIVSIISAAEHGDNEFIRQAITSGVDINACGKVDWWPHASRTALHVAAEKGRKRTVALLIALGAKVDVKDTNGETPLHLAAHEGHDEIVKMLLAKGANVGEETKGGNTPLHQAADATVKLLLKKGADVNAKNNRGETPLDKACESRQRMIGALQKAGGRLGITGTPRTDLFNAALAGNAGKVARILAKGVKPDIKNERGITPLHLAGSAQVAQILIAGGADIKAKTKIEEQTPLHWAAMRGFKDVVEVLIAEEADIKAKDENGFTSLHYACNSEIVALLIANGADVNVIGKVLRTPLNMAVSRFDMESVKLLLKEGASVRDEDLHSAAAVGDKELVELLIAKGADVNGESRNFGLRPLHFAALRGQREIADVLIAKGANVDARDCHHLTPLHVAAEWSHKDIVELLLAKGADVNARSYRSTPLDYTKTGEIEKLLRLHGAKSGKEK